MMKIKVKINIQFNCNSADKLLLFYDTVFKRVDGQINLTLISLASDYLENTCNNKQYY